LLYFVQNITCNMKLFWIFCVISKNITIFHSKTFPEHGLADSLRRNGGGAAETNAGMLENKEISTVFAENLSGWPIPERRPVCPRTADEG
jgi:hypothetical protein